MSYSADLCSPWDHWGSSSMWEYLREKISSYKATRRADCHIPALLSEAGTVLPDSLFLCVTLAVSVSQSDGGFFLSFLSPFFY